MNGFKYLFVSAAVLFTAVFGMTSCGGDNTDTNTETQTGTAGTLPGTSASSASEETSSGITITADEYTLSGTPASTTTGTAAADPEGAEDTWAMFLVNEQNPLPRTYDDYIQLELVDVTYREYYLDKRCAAYMRDMLAAAKNDGIELMTSSAYRSYDYQQSNFENSMQYRMEDGMSEDEAYEDTVKQVQLPGQSEHNAGLAVDILSNEYTSMDDSGFENTKAFEWLSKHAAEFGFILRYPKGKEDITGIIYEPWHYRFVGVYYAKDIESTGLTLEEYFSSKGWTDESGTAIRNTVYDRNPGLKRSMETETAAAVPSVPDTEDEFFNVGSSDDDEDDSEEENYGENRSD